MWNDNREYLVKNKYAAPDGVTIIGGSNGGNCLRFSLSG